MNSLLMSRDKGLNHKGHEEHKGRTRAQVIRFFPFVTFVSFVFKRFP